MSAPRRTVLELAAFAALAWYTAAHWTSGLIADAPAGRVFACVMIATAVAVALLLSEAVRGVPGVALRGGCVVAGLGAGFVAVGLDRRLLAPAHWDELGDGLDRGFATLGAVDWPYDGAEPWAGQLLLLAVPLVLTIAAALAFWPRVRLRPFALILLIALYGIAVTEHQFDGELGRGMVLLLLTAAWLWLPRLPERGWSAAAAAGGAVLVACLVALPAAARYDERDPVLDYQSWNPFETVAATSFEWNHSYGPIDWPRDGKTLMNVRSDDRNYWKVETLDQFDGKRWVHSRFGLGNNPLLPEPYREEWETHFRVTIRDLDTDLFPIAGTALRIEGADPVVVADDDGTVSAVGESLDKGDSYEVDAYVPQPIPAQMRAAPVAPGEDLLPYVPEAIAASTEILLPGDSVPVRPDGISVEARGHQGEVLDRQVLASPYARVWRLSRRLADGPADCVRRRPVRAELPPHRVHLRRAAAAARLSARGVPLPRSRRLLPAVLGGDGADAADAWHPRARRRRLHARLVQRGHQGVPRAGSRRPLMGGGLVHEGRLGAVRPDALGRSGRLAVERQRRVGIRRIGNRRRGAGRPRPVRRRPAERGPGRG